MIREETEVAERFSPSVKATFGQRLKFAFGLKSKVPDHWTHRIRLWFRKITLLQQFMLSTFMVIGLAMVAAGAWMSARIEDEVLRSNAGAAALYMSSFIEPHVQSIDDNGVLSSDDLVNLAKISSEFAVRRRVASMKLWRPDGTILYSTRKEIIGKRFSNVAVQASLTGEIRVISADLDEDDSEYERSLAMPLYEIFAPVYKNGTGKIIAVAEFYRTADELFGARTVPNVWFVVGGSALGMFIFLFAIVHRGSVKIEQQRLMLKRRLREQARLRRTNTQLEKKMRDALTQAARIDELIQRRLGAELHDGPAQLIALVLLRLDEIRNTLEEPSTSAAVVDNLRSVASEALRTIRVISSDLFLPDADGAGDLVEVLGAVVGNHQRRTNSAVALNVKNIPERLSTEIIRCVARVVQEALNNSFKHAGAANQSVSAIGAGHALIVSICDSGPGIKDANTLAPEKLGLKGMRYRVEAVGGALELRSRAENGTEVWCRIPLGARQIYISP
jgi:signal transduction histidine kinase